jgi:hypothetical protein
VLKIDQHHGFLGISNKSAMASLLGNMTALPVAPVSAPRAAANTSYTRAELQRLKQLDAERKARDTIKLHVDRVQNAVIAAATKGDTTYIYKLSSRIENAESAKQMHIMITGIMEDLNTIFPDTRVEYDKRLIDNSSIQFQDHLIGGIINHEICLDWS